MLALVIYGHDTNSKKIVFENEKAAELWLKKNHIRNPRYFDLVEVEYIRENDEELKRFDLEDKIKSAAEELQYITSLYEEYNKREDEDGKRFAEIYRKHVVTYTIKKHELEIELLKLDQEKAE